MATSEHTERLLKQLSDRLRDYCMGETDLMTLACAADAVASALEGDDTKELARSLYRFRENVEEIEYAVSTSQIASRTKQAIDLLSLDKQGSPPGSAGVAVEV